MSLVKGADVSTIPPFKVTALIGESAGLITTAVFALSAWRQRVLG
jgi:hypothetical protein